MLQILLSIPGSRSRCLQFQEDDEVTEILKTIQVRSSDFYLVTNGRRVDATTQIQDGSTYHIIPRVLGGKGGFGSMLRALGAQIEKTTNREACRDLSGRRMRDVNNEQRLREWVGRAADRERERDDRRKERLARRKAEPSHQFDDPNYNQQKSQVAESLQEAIQQGLSKASGSGTATATSRKRRSDDAGPGPSSGKRKFEWMGDGIDIDDLDTDSDDDEGQPSTPGLEERPDSDDSEPGRVEPGRVEPGRVEPVDSRSDSGVESVTDSKVKGSPMDIDSSEKDSALNSDLDVHMDNRSPSIHADMSPNSHAETLPGNQAEKLTESQEDLPVNLMNFSTQTDLESLGMEVLKSELISRGMKCGGTLQQRAERLWEARGLAQADIPTHLLAKPAGGKNKKR